MTNTDYERYLLKSIFTSNTTSGSAHYDRYATNRDWGRDEESMYTLRSVWRQNMKDIVYETLKPFEINRNGTTFVPVRNSKPPELPDSYPKGDLDDLLELNNVGNN